MNRIGRYLTDHAQDGLLPWAVEVQAAREFTLSCREIEIAALTEGIIPARYRRNRETLSLQDQMQLLKSHAAIVGCGGLGGHVIEQLARVGVGRLTVIDPDVFEEHNLNRQTLCTFKVLGSPKAAVARERVREINPAVEVVPVSDAFTDETGPQLLEGVQVAVDGLDSVSSRIVLGRLCSSLGVPLVHGSIGGWYGQVTTQMPGKQGIKEIYQDASGEDGIEKRLGNPSFSPALIGSMQAAEACKILLGAGHCLAGRMLFFDMLDMEMEMFRL